MMELLREKSAAVPAVFENASGGWKIRVVDKNGEPWFVAKDVCECLGHTNPGMAVSGLDDDERITISNPYGNPRAGEPLQYTAVSEPGLYSLVLRSRKPEAKAFRRWVTHDVIPSIRKHGMYATPKTVEDMLNDPDVMIGLLQGFKAERARAELAEKQAAIAIEDRDAQAARADMQEDRARRAFSGKGGLKASRNRQRRRAVKAENELAAVSEERDALKDELGVGKEWVRAAQIPWLGEVFDMRGGRSTTVHRAVGERLANMSRAMGVEIRSVQLPEYEVNVYRADVVAAFRARINSHPNMMRELRIVRRRALLDAAGISVPGPAA